MLLRTPNRNLAWIILLAAALLSAGGFLFASVRVQGPGFPLDDAWIHLTYARNLGQQGEWAFVPGKPSAGSTAPLWTGLLAIGYVFHIPAPYAWTFGLGILSLAGLAWVGQRYFWLETKTGYAAWLPWAGLFLLGEYHLVWASVSGMETVLMGLFYLAGFYGMSRVPARWGWIGVLIGLSVWIRPDGITLLGPAFFVIALTARTWRAGAALALRLVGGFSLFFLPYLLFNLQFQGSIWPNTFYAKQAEYIALQARPLALRLVDELSLPMIGAGILLLPGFLTLAWRASVEKHWPVVAAAIWFLGYAGLYAWRLPVTYQYGRYLIPAMPVYFTIGIIGLALLAARWAGSRAGRLVGFAYRLILAGVWLGFYFLGARNYARDVAIIETEMVAAAKWVSAATSPEELIAVHDIGAMGYFGGREVVDLAGLVTPEVIPFIRDEARLASYLDERGADYLVTFPGWYDHLDDGLVELYSTKGGFAPGAGGENLKVYRWD